MDEGTGKRRLFGAEAMGRVVVAVRAGASFAAAARAAGISPSAVGNARKRVPAFDAACAAAVRAGDVPRLVYRKGGDGTGWQVRRGRAHKFDAERNNLFPSRFAATLDSVGAAEAAGVCFSTAYEHRRTDPAFAEAWAEAARIGVERISEEAGRQRLAAMAAIRVMPGAPVVPEAGPEFERTMTFLKIWWSRVNGAGAAGGGSGGDPAGCDGLGDERADAGQARAGAAAATALSGLGAPASPQFGRKVLP